MKKILLSFILASSIMYGSDDICSNDVCADNVCTVTHRESIEFIGSFRRIETTTDAQWTQLCDKILQLQDLVMSFGLNMFVTATDTEHNKNAYAQYQADESIRTYYYLVDDIAFSLAITRPDAVTQDEWSAGETLFKSIISCPGVARGVIYTYDKNRFCGCGSNS